MQQIRRQVKQRNRDSATRMGALLARAGVPACGDQTAQAQNELRPLRATSPG
jgi:hypothetical protein